MFLLMCLLPLALAAPLETTLDNYKLDIEETDSGRILKNVEFKSDEVSELDLSNMNLHKIDENALQNVPSIKSLNLSNNIIDTLPTSVFSNLAKLEYLSLADNNLRYLRDHFVGLKNLQTLDISNTVRSYTMKNNRITTLNIGEKSGLSKSVTIIITNNFLGQISNRGQENELESHDSVNPANANFPPLNNSLNITVCITDGKVTSVANIHTNEDLPSECTNLNFIDIGPIFLQYLEITALEKGWYNIQLSSIYLITFSHNEINAITEHTLNDLPAHITVIDLDSNRIKDIHKGIIKNTNIKTLSLQYNEIEYIEADAFAETSLKKLLLRGNKIADITFVSSLPQSLKYLNLSENRITSIPDELFVNLPKLKELFLDFNAITRLQNHALDGLNCLEQLRLTNNNMTEIEPEAFRDLQNLEELMCGVNHLGSFPSNVWSPLKSLKHLHLDENGITEVSKDLLSSLPKTLESLYLQWNNISNIDSDSFNEVPRRVLDLSHNEINNIPRGVLNLPKLKELNLSGNNLTVIDPESYEGLPELETLLLSENGITDIVKGACKNFGNLKELDVSFNSIEELKNGALYGLNGEKLEYVSLRVNNLEKIHGGAFDDV